MARYDELLAIDHGSAPQASADGVLDNVFRPIGPSPKTGRPVLIGTFEILRQALEDGQYVSLEISTYGGFGFRSLRDELLALKERFPGKMLTIGTHAVRNEARRNGVEPGKIDNALAAALNWQIVQRDGAKEWPGPTPEALRVVKHDPRRPLRGTLIDLRDSGYDGVLMQHEVYKFWPPLHGIELDDDQRTIFDNNPDRIAAMVMSVREVVENGSKRNRDNWESVLQNHRDGRPNLYRQMIGVGKPRADYVKGVHFTGLPVQRATSAMRRLRTKIDALI